jgi:hypothetical protein
LDFARELGLEFSCLLPEDLASDLAFVFTFGIAALARVLFFALRLGRLVEPFPVMPRTARTPAPRTASAPSTTVSPIAERALLTRRLTPRVDRLTVFTAELAASATGSVTFSNVLFDRFFGLMSTSLCEMRSPGKPPECSLPALSPPPPRQKTPRRAAGRGVTNQQTI